MICISKRATYGGEMPEVWQEIEQEKEGVLVKAQFSF
jgi:hypothetical protein